MAVASAMVQPGDAASVLDIILALPGAQATRKGSCCSFQSVRQLVKFPAAISFHIPMCNFQDSFITDQHPFSRTTAMHHRKNNLFEWRQTS